MALKAGVLDDRIDLGIRAKQALGWTPLELLAAANSSILLVANRDRDPRLMIDAVADKTLMLLPLFSIGSKLFSPDAKGGWNLWLKQVAQTVRRHDVERVEAQRLHGLGAHAATDLPVEIASPG